MHGFISGLSILFHWSMYLFLYSVHLFFFYFETQRQPELIPKLQSFFLSPILLFPYIFHHQKARKMWKISFTNPPFFFFLEFHFVYPLVLNFQQWKCIICEREVIQILTKNLRWNAGCLDSKKIGVYWGLSVRMTARNN